MGTVEIRLFGQISVQRSGQPLAGLSTKALELFSYLLLYRERGHTRETLGALLWPDVADGLARKYLRQTIWQLQSVLAGDSSGASKTPEGVLDLRPGWIGVNPGAAWWLDVAAFEQAHEMCRDIPGRELTDPQAQALEAAMVLYRGDLTEAWYQDWCIYERDRLQLTYLTMLEKLMGYCEARQRYAKGVAYGQSILRYDPARESAYRQLMRLHYRAGDRTTALRQYERCAAVMAKHFGIPPSQETAALYRQIRADRLDDNGPEEPPATRRAGEPGGGLLLGLHARLDQFQAELAASQRQVQRELTSIRRVLARGDRRDERL